MNTETTTEENPQEAIPTKKYNVHIYRETRFKFEGIEATSPDEAANLAAEMHSDQSTEWEECNGDNLGALVDLVGDEDYTDSVLIDFEPERVRKAAQKLLAACQMVVDRWEKGDLVS